MRRIIAVWIVMLMLIGGIIGIVNLSTDAEHVGNGDAGVRAVSQFKSGLTPHDPIYIHNNSDFASQASSEGWAGDGIEGNPYIIENYDIDANTAHGIQIKNTNVYFIIRNCVIHDGSNIYDGIYFYKVQNGKIDNATSYNNYCGIWLDSSSNNSINACTVYGNNAYAGIVLRGSSNNIISACKAYGDNYYGIRVEYSSNNNIISACTVYNNDYGGIRFDDCSDNIISACTVYFTYLGNNAYGIDIRSSSNNSISACTVYNNTYEGICLTFSNDNSITNCIIHDNSWDGIYLGTSSSNSITSNQIYSNYQGISLSYSSSNNEIHYNNIYDNTNYGVYNHNPEDEYQVDATYNWWGDASGPGGVGPGSGDAVSSNVLYYPWNEKPELTLHTPIYINGNANFTFANGVISGSGMENDPYIIENWDINASSAVGIFIWNTDVYFIIRNCVVYDGNNNDGIFFYKNVVNGKIDNIISYNNFWGIGVYSSSNNSIISNCTVYNNSDGIVLGSSSNQITGCNVYSNQYGIYLVSSSDNQITNCTAYSNSHDGIRLGSSSNNNNIIDCTVYNNVRYGIWLEEASNNNRITNCDVYNNDDGIYLKDSSDNEIRYCNIYGNSEYGVNNYNSETTYKGDATYNWWGSADGPSGGGSGSGDAVSDNVLYNPWLTEPWTGENQPPVADFTYSPALIVSTTGRIINFMDLSYDPDGDITAWFWGFGDNNTSTEQNPTHQYPVAGNYTVNLTVTDDDGATNTTSKEITITILDIGIITNISLTITNISLSNFTIVNLSWLNISCAVNITNLSIINISCINITNLMNISNTSFANVFEVALTNFTYMSSSSFINVSYVNITQSMSVNNLMFDNVSYVYLQNITSVNFVIAAISNIITITYENLQMVIPAEALNLSMPFNLSASSASLPSGYDVVGDIYRIECGVSVSAPISITLSYAGIVLPPRINEDDLAVYKKVGDNWIKVDSTVDKLNSTVSAQVTSFSDYAILYKQPSTEDGEESKPSAKPFEIPWLYILIPIIVIVVVAGAGLGINRRKKKLPPEKPAG